MTGFTISFHSAFDAPAVLKDPLGEISALKVSRKIWARVLAVMGANIPHYLHESVKDLRDLRSEAYDLTIASGNVNPAKLGSCDGCIVELISFNNVSVKISVRRQIVTVVVDFNRDSTFLATMMLAGFARRIPEARSLLAQAAAELAAKKY